MQLCMNPSGFGSDASADALWLDAKYGEQRYAGASLLTHMLGLYAVGKLTAIGLCISCYYIARAGTPGADLDLYALSRVKAR